MDHDPIIFIALGSNLGERQDNLAAALQAMSSFMDIQARSPIYITPPWGFVEQPEFLNQVIQGTTTLTPDQLLQRLKTIENELGRTPTFRFGPRVIDLDILLFDDLVVHSADLEIPHPRLSSRAFVLVPLVDLAPGLRHPVSGKSMAELLQRVNAAGIRPYQADTHPTKPA